MKKKRFSPLVIFLFLFYIAILLKLTVFRDGFVFDSQSFFTKGSIVLKPASTYIMMYKHKAYGLMAYNLLGNIIMFIPFGFCVKYINYKIKPLRLMLTGIVLSFCIEFAQYMFGTGVSDIDDIILNTLGVMIGGLVLGNIFIKGSKRGKKQ